MGLQVLVPFRGSEDSHWHLKLVGDLVRYLKSKAAAVEAVLQELPEATVMKPAVMFGREDRILNPWAHVARNYSFLPLIGDGSTKIQPVYVVDVASAIVTALKDDVTSMGKVYELGGPDIFTVHELYDVIRKWPRYVKIPFPIAKAIAMLEEIFLKKVPVLMPTPTIFNLDLIEASCHWYSGVRKCFKI
ncbi:NADH dehydrogenase [ubiquinone] 1 alpha subcomplex subunit 9, mitochondrial [Olea europaea subsp. europaea]|nr:NADH dehydrogenase [ubiquinone] 1 alpha subcomplex subunit 9, mitochondrial [Olea europaea subsp. europaea]